MSTENLIWEVGDEVWDSFYYPNKKGEVIEIDENIIRVKFEGNLNISYLHDGRYFGGYSSTLSFTPYEVPAMPVTHIRPEPEYPIGTKGYFWDDEGDSLLYCLYDGKEGRYFKSRAFDGEYSGEWSNFSPTLPDWAK